MSLLQGLLLLLVVFLFLIGYLLWPRKYPSIASIKDGSWDDPKTWNQKRIPTVGDIVSINHVIKLDNIIELGKDEMCKPKLYNVKDTKKEN